MASDAEEELRIATEAWMRQRWPAARIVHELVCSDGAQRIDLASVGDEELRLVEIKSAKDVLKRLPNQISAALQCAQEVWVAIDAKHADKMDLLWERIGTSRWSIGLLMWRDGALFEKQQANNAQPDPRQVVRLLWSDEMRTHLIASNNQREMIRLAVDAYGLRHIMRKVCIALKARPFPRADQAEGPAPLAGLFTKASAKQSTPPPL